MLRALGVIGYDDEKDFLGDWARAYDQHCIANKLSQRYGTVLAPNGDLLLPIAGCNATLTDYDIEKINARREDIGLLSIQEQRLQYYKDHISINKDKQRSK